MLMIMRMDTGQPSEAFESALVVRVFESVIITVKIDGHKSTKRSLMGSFCRLGWPLNERVSFQSTPLAAANQWRRFSLSLSFDTLVANFCAHASR